MEEPWMSWHICREDGAQGRRAGYLYPARRRKWTRGCTREEWMNRQVDMHMA